MKKQENAPLRTPEDMLALAEALAARHVPATAQVRKPLPRWAHNLLWAAGGAGTVGLCWLTSALG